MRYRFYLFINFLFILSSANAKTISGAAADKVINGAEVIITSSQGSPSYVRFQKDKAVNADAVVDWMKSALSPGEQWGFRLLKRETDNLGMTHTRYQQTFNGVQVEGAIYIVHEKDGKATALNGLLSPQLTLSVQPALTEAQALDKALDYMHAVSYRWQSATLERHLKEITGNENATWFPKGILTILPPTTEGSAAYHLVYKFDIYATEPLRREYVYVDARDGKILYTRNRIELVNATGTAITGYSGTKSITTDMVSAGNYRLRETGRGNGIRTYNMQATTDYNSAVDFTDADNVWNNVNSVGDQFATDAHWGAEKTYDFYLQNFGRNSIDNNGYALVSYVHYGTNYNNAFWDGFEMTYGDGNSSYNPFTSLDIAGHEISHGLTQETSNLSGQNEAAALNEGFSDCMGAAIRYFGKQAANIDWVIGDEIVGPPFRSMSNPKLYENPDTYKGTYWDFNTQESHQNSTILSHWFYILTQGKTGTNDNGSAYSVSGLGIAKSQAICYRMNTVYLTPNSNYADARTYSIQAAIDLYGSCSNEVYQTTNAWYAVGVGAAFVPQSVTSDFTASITSGCSAPLTVNFSNNSNNAQNYIWYFGDNTSSTSVSPAHTYTSYGTYTVTLTASSTLCGSATLPKPGYIVITNQSPSVASVATQCRNAGVTLNATGADTVKWYTAASGGTAVATGKVFNTPALTSSSVTYYAESNIYPPQGRGGPPDSSLGPGGYFSNAAERALVFNCTTPVRLVNVTVYAQAAGSRTINLRDNLGNILQSKNIVVPVGKSVVTLNFDLPAGNNLSLGCSNANIFRNTGGANYPYTIGGIISIIDNSVHLTDNGQAINYYYFFYDWHIQAPSCVTSRTPVTVAVDSAGFSYSLNALTATFTNKSKNAASFLWKFGGGVNDTSTQVNPVHIYTPGTYTVTLLAKANGCTDSTSQVINLIPTSIGTYAVSSFAVYPNPAKNQLTVAGLPMNDKATVDIYNVIGKKVKSVFADMINVKEHSINITDLAPGVYFIQINIRDMKWTARFMKE